jgi:acyl dehydratase
MMIQPGLTLESLTLAPITREQLKAYAEASGDYNRIHLDDEVAQKFGLPGIIAHGMLIAAWMSEKAQHAMVRELGLKEYSLVKYQTRFRAMTFLGDTPVVGGRVKSFSDEGITLELQVKNQRGELVASGLAQFRKL